MVTFSFLIFWWTLTVISSRAFKQFKDWLLAWEYSNNWGKHEILTMFTLAGLELKNSTANLRTSKFRNMVPCHLGYDTVLHLSEFLSDYLSASRPSCLPWIQSLLRVDYDYPNSFWSFFFINQRWEHISCLISVHFFQLQRDTHCCKKTPVSPLTYFWVLWV